MSYEEFLEYIVTHIAERFAKRERLKRQNENGDEPEQKLTTQNPTADLHYLVERNTTVKNNGVLLDGLTIRREGEQTSPNIYLNGYYKSYQMGKSVLVIMDEILDQYDRLKSEKQVKIDDFTDFNLAKDKIILRLVNYEMNRNMLRDCPHKRYMDLVIIFQYLAGKDSNGISSFLITNEQLALWQIEPDELYQIALCNTMREFPWKIDSLSDVIAECVKNKWALGRDVKEGITELSQTEGGIVLYVLTNDMGLNGATCILYDGVVRNFAKLHEANLYLLPSSLHEMMIVIEDENTDPKFLQELVED